MLNAPIIRLEIERMRHAIVMMVSEYEAKFDQELRKAVEDFCSEENINAIISQQVRETLKAVICEEIKKFYTYGEGRKIVKQAVEKRLSEASDLVDLY